MKEETYFSSGKFAKMAQVTLRTIRYYDQQNILKPSYVNDAGARFYTEKDFAKLQQILLFKYLGFSLSEIREMTLDNFDCHFMLNSLDIQKKLIQDRIEQMHLIEQAIEETSSMLRSGKDVDWNQMRELIHLTAVEKSLKNQYQNASNISSRIQLHNKYSVNKQSWFLWLYEQCHLCAGEKILEIGCGDGTLWISNQDRLPSSLPITLSDLSDGMLRDARRNLVDSNIEKHFSFTLADAAALPFEDNSFDLVIANHVLFYCTDIAQVCSEIYRVLKPGGRFIASTYGKTHMQEISRLVADFDSRIVLSADKLYERFGKENGADFLTPLFSHTEWIDYDDELFVTEAEPLISYILSCHGNQNEYLLNRYTDFRNFVKKKVQHGFSVTKEAGIFSSRKAGKKNKKSSCR